MGKQDPVHADLCGTRKRLALPLPVRVMEEASDVFMVYYTFSIFDYSLTSRSKRMNESLCQIQDLEEE